MSDQPGRKWNVDPKTKELYYYSKSEGAYIYYTGRKVYQRIHGRAAGSQLDQDPPLPPPPQKTLILRCRWKYNICSIDSIRQLAIKQLGPKAENYPIETQFVDDGKPAKFIWGSERDEEKKEIKLTLPIRTRSDSKPSNPPTRAPPRRVYQNPSSRPMATSWKDFLLSEKASTPKQVPMPTQQSPYASMPLERKMQRANLLLCYSMFKAMQKSKAAATDKPASSTSGDASDNGRGYSSSNTSDSGQRRGKKRGRDSKSLNGAGSSDIEDDGENSDDAHRSKRPTPVGGKAAPNWNFACHYGKRHPSHFQKPICRTRGFDDINRLKQHLQRCHKLPPLRCEPCSVTFDNLKAMRKHSQSSVACGIKCPSEPYDGFTSQQWEKIKCRKRPKAQPGEHREEAMWKHIYLILFADQKDFVPSPYHSNDQHTRRQPEQSPPFHPDDAKPFQEFLNASHSHDDLRDLLKQGRDIPNEHIDHMDFDHMLHSAEIEMDLIVSTEPDLTHYFKRETEVKIEGASIETFDFAQHVQTVQPTNSPEDITGFDAFTEYGHGDVATGFDMYLEELVAMQYRPVDQVLTDPQGPIDPALLTVQRHAEPHHPEHHTNVPGPLDKGKGRAQIHADQMAIRPNISGSPVKIGNGNGGTILGIRGRESKSPMTTTPPVASS